MDFEEHRTALRVAVYRRDGPAIVDLLTGVGGYHDSLQLAGDGLIAALMDRVAGAPEVAGDLVVGLRRRGWDGDDELADQLGALLSGGPVPRLRPLPVDLDELAGILEAAIEYALETGEEDEDAADDPERWLPAHGEGSGQGYRDMELFIASVRQPDRAERLALAITGRGAFRRFKDELARWPGELARWYALAEERQRGRARSWLAAAGYWAVPADQCVVSDNARPGPPGG